MRYIGVCAAVVLSAAGALADNAKPPAPAPAPDPEQIAALVRGLGDEDFAKREQAEEELARLGAAALPALRTAATGKDLEAAGRARQIISRIGWNGVRVRFGKIAGQADA